MPEIAAEHARGDAVGVAGRARTPRSPTATSSRRSRPTRPSVDVEAEGDGVHRPHARRPGHRRSRSAPPMALIAAPGETVADVDAVAGRARRGTEHRHRWTIPTPAGRAATRSRRRPRSPTPRGRRRPDRGAGRRPRRGAADLSQPARPPAGRETGCALEDLTGTGPGGRIVRDDVRRAARAAREHAEPPASPAAPTPPSDRSTAGRRAYDGRAAHAGCAGRSPPG